MRERAAYLPLLGAPFVYARSPASRQPLRRTIANALRTMNPKMTADCALISAHIIVELIKGLLTVYKQAAPKDKETVAKEFKKLLKLYLFETLAS